MDIIKKVRNAIFGNYYVAIWQKFVDEKGGFFVPNCDIKVRVPVKSFDADFSIYSHYTTVSKTSYQSLYTRGILEFFANDNYELLITQQGIVENVSKLFGAQDITIGQKKFDRKFMLKSNDEAKTLLLMSDKSISELMLRLKTIRLYVGKREGLFGELSGNGNSMLYYVMDGEATKCEELEWIYQLISSVLEGLVKNSSIRPAKTS